MICKELVSRSGNTTDVDLDRYMLLHPDGKKLISSWFVRAWRKNNCEPEDTFEPFIFSWISFNGWAACVTELDRDRDWLDALMKSKKVCGDFDRMVADTNSSVSRYAREFHKILPIFRAQEIRRSYVDRHHSGIRSNVVEHYLSSGIKQFEPQCWQRHKRDGTPIPIDWPHTLGALYRVRCNLFHGEKFAHSEMDVFIVSAAFKVFVNFIKNANYITYK